MFSIVIIMLIIYYMYSSLSNLFTTTDPWGWLQWIVLLLNVLFVPILVLLIRRAIREQKEKAEKQAEEAKKAALEKRKMFDDEYDSIDARTSDAPIDAEEDEDEGAREAGGAPAKVDVEAEAVVLDDEGPSAAERQLEAEREAPDAAELEKIAPDVKVRRTRKKKDDQTAQ